MKGESKMKKEELPTKQDWLSILAIAGLFILTSFICSLF